MVSPLPVFIRFHPMGFPLGLRTTEGAVSLGCEVAADPSGDPLGGMAVPVGIPGGGHGAIGNLVGEQPSRVLDDGRGVRASQ
jgi:hypothetical protein